MTNRKERKEKAQRNRSGKFEWILYRTEPPGSTSLGEILSLRPKIFLLKNKKIIHAFSCMAMVVATLVYYSFSFICSSSSITIGNAGEVQLASLSTPHGHDVLISHTVNAPSPSVTIFSGSSFGFGFKNKPVQDGALRDSFFEKSFYTSYLKETMRSILQPLQLHLTFCVLRI